MTFLSTQQSQNQTQKEGDRESFVSKVLVSGLIRHLYKLTRHTDSFDDLDIGHA